MTHEEIRKRGQRDILFAKWLMAAALLNLAAAVAVLWWIA